MEGNGFFSDLFQRKIPRQFEAWACEEYERMH
jgi:hypothetical protein